MAWWQHAVLNSGTLLLSQEGSCLEARWQGIAIRNTDGCWTALPSGFKAAPFYATMPSQWARNTVVAVLLQLDFKHIHVKDDSVLALTLLVVQQEGHQAYFWGPAWPGIMLEKNGRLNKSRVATNLENLEYSGISLNVENSGNSQWILCNVRETNKQSIFSLSFKYLCTTAVDWVMWISDSQSVVVTCYIAGVDVEWPLMKVIITSTFCCDNLWKSKFMALEKPGKTLVIFFSYFVATLKNVSLCVCVYFSFCARQHLC